jgi:hypothetical protein
MKKVIVLSVMIAGLFMTSQLMAQVDGKSSEKQPASEQKKDPNSTTTGKDQKVQMGGYTKSGQTVTPANQPSSVTTSKDQGKEQGGTVKEKPPVSGSVIYDRLGEKMAMIEADGSIRDTKGNILGRYANNGDFTGPTGEKIAWAKDGVIRTRDGKEAGRIAKDGKVTNAKGKTLGTIYDDGTVRNSKGSRLGSAPGVDKNLAAIIFFHAKKSTAAEKSSKKKNSGSKTEFKMSPVEQK